MPYFNASPFAALAQKLIPGQPAYVFGSWAQDTAPTCLYVSKVSITSDFATLSVGVTKGNIPIVGALITVRGTTVAAGVFNVLNVPLTGVTINAEGVGTVTFALSHSDVATTVNAGEALVPQPEIPDALTDGASIAVGLPFATEHTENQQAQSVTAVVKFPSLPTTAVVTLEGAIQNNDAEFTANGTLGTVCTVTAGSVAGATFVNYNGKFNFYRLVAASVTGETNPTIIGKILV